MVNKVLHTVLTSSILGHLVAVSRVQAKWRDESFQEPFLKTFVKPFQARTLLTGPVADKCKNKGKFRKAKLADEKIG